MNERKITDKGGETKSSQHNKKKIRSKIKAIKQKQNLWVSMKDCYLP